MRRAAIAAVAALCLLAAAGGPAAGSTVAVAGGPAPAEPVAGQLATPTNGTPVRHVDPETTRPVDYGRLEGWLGGELAGRLGTGVAALDRADYERARALLGDDAEGYLRLLDDVAAATAGTEDDRLARTLERTVEDQRRLTTEVEAFRETAADYREARAAGDEDRARRLARELTEQAAAVDERGDALTTDYETVGTLTGRDVSAETETVEAISANVSATAESAAAASLEPSVVSLVAADDRAAFDDPLAVSGRVRTANGSAIADGRVRLLVDGRTLATGRTDAEGAYALSARPMLVPTGTRPATVRFVPAADAPYRGATATTAVRVDAVEPAVTLEPGTSGAGFGDRVPVAGTVRVGATPVPGVPVTVRLAGDRQLALETAADGSFAGGFALPAAVEPGESTVTAAVDTAGLAVGPATAEAPLTVTQRRTTLQVDVEPTGPATARVTGRLVAEGGVPVPDQPVALDVDGSRLDTVQTDGEGRFATVVDRPAEDGSVAAAFAARGTNLAPASASAALPAAPAQPTPLDPADGPLPVAAGLLALLVVAAAAVWYRRSRGTAAPAGEGDVERATEPPTAAAPALLARARELRAAGRPALAVRVAYGAVRERLGGADAAAATHWEFYRDRADGLAAPEAAALRSLSEAFERAAFAGDPPDPASVDRAIEAATVLAPDPPDRPV